MSQSITDLSVSVKVHPRRKHTCLEVMNDQIIIKAPRRLQKRTIDRLLHENKAFIDKALSKAKATMTFREGEALSYLGTYYPILIEQSTKSTVFIQEGQFKVFSNNAYPIRSLVVDFYINQAKIYLSQRLQLWEQITGFLSSGLNIRDFKARYGSCDSHGNIQLNWRIMMAPDWVIDYVIVHELCHLREFNHSKQFWQLVAKFCPQYKASKHWLHENSALIFYTI